MTTPVTATSTAVKVTVELELVEAIAVGHSLRALAKSRAFPASETAAMYRNVGDALVRAAHESMVRR